MLGIELLQRSLRSPSSDFPPLTASSVPVINALPTSPTPPHPPTQHHLPLEETTLLIHRQLLSSVDRLTIDVDETDTAAVKDVAQSKEAVLMSSESQMSSSQDPSLESPFLTNRQSCSYLEFDDFGEQVLSKGVMDRLFALQIDSGMDVFSVGLFGKFVAVTVRHDDKDFDVDKIRNQIASCIPCDNRLVLLGSTSRSDMELESLTGAPVCSANAEGTHRGPIH